MGLVRRLQAGCSPRERAESGLFRAGRRRAGARPLATVRIDAPRTHRGSELCAAGQLFRWTCVRVGHHPADVLACFHAPRNQADAQWVVGLSPWSLVIHVRPVFDAITVCGGA